MKTAKALPADRPASGADPAWPCLWLVPDPVAGGHVLRRGQGPESVHVLSQGIHAGQLQGDPAPRQSDTVNQFPQWFMNTFTIAIFTCIISSLFVLMVAYAMSCMRFKARKPLMNHGDYHESVPRLPVDDRCILHHEEPEPDQLHDGHGDRIFGGLRFGLSDCEGLL